VTEADFAAAPERDGVRVVNVTPGGPGPGQAGWWLRGAAVALGVLAAAAAAVSWDAQYAMVRAAKPVPVVAALEAGIPDVGAVVFAALGVALALHGKRALRSRALNAACIGISLGMNALAAGRGWRDLAIWVMPAAVYAVVSDTLIVVVRAWVLARARHQGEALADDGPTPLAAVAGLGLWLLRLSLAPRSTLTGFRSWVITDCPVAPGLRPGHLAELEAARRDADQRIALAARQHDEALEQVTATARQAGDEATRARAAETGIRAELDRTRADASQLVTNALADAARERGDLRAQSEQHAEQLRTELQQVREVDLSRCRDKASYAEHGTMPTLVADDAGKPCVGGFLEAAAGCAVGIVAQVGLEFSLDRTRGPAKGDGDDRPHEGSGPAGGARRRVPGGAGASGLHAVVEGVQACRGGEAERLAGEPWAGCRGHLPGPGRGVPV
jgi:hypothetical protein